MPETFSGDFEAYQSTSPQVETNVDTSQLPPDNELKQQKYISHLLTMVEESSPYELKFQRETLPLRRELREANGGAARVILDRLLTQRQEFSESETYEKILPLYFCAGPNEAAAIGQLIDRNYLATHTASSEQYLPLEILSRIGSSQNIPDLLSIAHIQKEFYEQHKETDRYSSFKNHYHKLLTELLCTLACILQRSPDAYSQKQAYDGLQQLYSLLNASEGNLGYKNLDMMVDNAYWSYEIQFEDRWDSAIDDAAINLGHSTSTDALAIKGDDEADRDLAQLCIEHKNAEAQSRLESIRWLHAAKEQPEYLESASPIKDVEQLFDRNHLEYQESSPSPYAPTMGIEIELRHKDALPPEAQSWSELDKYCYLSKMKHEKYKPTKDHGLPAGKDAFWEFALKPAYHYHTLSREVQAIIELGLIDKSEGKHALHITLGGITSEGLTGKEALALSRALEATGWSTTGGRLMRPYLTSLDGWNYKGELGVNERGSDLQLGVDRAIELRTFQLQTLTGLDRTLSSAYALGAALKCYQQEVARQGGPEPDPTRTQLAMMWCDFDAGLRILFDKYGLNTDLGAWNPPELYKNVRGPDTNYTTSASDFASLARLLDQAAEDQDSLGGQFVSEARRLVIHYRGAIHNILKSTQPLQIEDPAGGPEPLTMTAD